MTDISSAWPEFCFYKVNLKSNFQLWVGSIIITHATEEKRASRFTRKMKEYRKMKRTLTKIAQSLVILVMAVSFVSANSVVNVTFLGEEDMLSKAAMGADIYKNHERKSYNASVGMIPITVDAIPQQAYCFDIETDGITNPDSFDLMLLKEATLISDEIVDQIAYIVNQFPLEPLGTPETKLKGATIQNSVWHLLYDGFPLYTIYPTVAPVPPSQMPMTDAAKTGADLVIENATTDALQASAGKRLLEGDGSGSLQLNLTQDPNNSNRVLVVLTASQGTSQTCGQPVSLFTDKGVFEGSAADFIEGVTDSQGQFQAVIDLSNVTWTTLVANCHKPKPQPCPEPDPEPQTFSITVAAEAAGRSVYLLLSQGNAYQDMIYTQPGDYTTSATCSIEFDTCGTPRTIGFWKHQVKCALQNKKAQVSKQTLSSFLPIWILGGVQVDSLQEMYDILWLKNASMRQRAQQQYLATMLNIEWGQIEWSDYVDTNYDGNPDMTLWQAILTANLAFNWKYYEVAKNICDSINNSGEAGASATPLQTSSASKR